MLDASHSSSSSENSPAPDLACSRLAPRFALGQVVATPQALAALVAADVSPDAFLSRHGRGDWGDVAGEDQNANDRALVEGARLLSVYTLPGSGEPAAKENGSGVVIWVITEWDRSSTTLLLPSEY